MKLKKKREYIISWKRNVLLTAIVESTLLTEQASCNHDLKILINLVHKLA